MADASGSQDSETLHLRRAGRRTVTSSQSPRSPGDSTLEPLDAAEFKPSRRRSRSTIGSCYRQSRKPALAPPILGCGLCPGRGKRGRGSAPASVYACAHLELWLQQLRYCLQGFDDVTRAPPVRLCWISKFSLPPKVTGETARTAQPLATLERSNWSRA